MRKIVLFFLFFSAQTVFSQQFDFKYFTLQDGDLDSGSVMRRYDIFFDFNKATLLPQDSIPLKTIADWLIFYAELTIEIGQHADIQNPQMSSNLTAARANSIMKRLIEYGVPPTQLIAKGYGAVRNIIPQTVISKEPSLAKKDSLRALNRRTEFRIIKVNPQLMKTFLLSDTVFHQGQVLRTYRFWFDYNGTKIHDDNLPQLDSIVAFLKKHPQLKIEIGQHTTLAGSVEYDSIESTNMSIAIRDYFISKGISPGRMIAKGYGRNLPIYNEEEINRTMEKEKQQFLHQQNRRTEFKIISVK